MSDRTSTNLNWSGGFHITQTTIGLVYVIRSSMKIFIISLEMQHLLL